MINKDKEYEHKYRKTHGIFYTPVDLVETVYAQINKMIDLNQYKIYDPCAGTGNLLRSYNGDMNNIYMSTLEQSDVEDIQGDPFFKGSHVFQRDIFSEDPLPPEIDEEMKNHKKWMIILNPPWSTAQKKTEYEGHIYDHFRERGMPDIAREMINRSLCQVRRIIEKYDLEAFCVFFHHRTLLLGMKNSSMEWMREWLNLQYGILHDSRRYGISVEMSPCIVSFWSTITKSPEIVKLEIDDPTNRYSGYINYDQYMDKEKTIYRELKYLEATPNIVRPCTTGPLIDSINSDNPTSRWHDKDLFLGMVHRFGEIQFESTNHNYWFGCGWRVQENMIDRICVYLVKKYMIQNAHWPLRSDNLYFSGDFEDSANVMIWAISTHYVNRMTSFSYLLHDIRNNLHPMTKSEFLSIPNLSEELINDCNSSPEPWLPSFLERNKSKIKPPFQNLLDLHKEMIISTISHRIDHDHHILRERWDAGYFHIHRLINKTINPIPDHMIEYSKARIECEEYLKLQIEKIDIGYHYEIKGIG